jgi:exopolyphosphatase/guanosine-5'-triphosphate,3'-diphosphate pyrophosphatase
VADDARRVAVIDLGSNSWRVVLYSYATGGWWKRTDELCETVRIGAGLGTAGRLSEDAIERGLQTLGVFEHFCGAWGLAPSQVHVVATSAIRDAANRAQFVRRAQESTGLAIEVLSEADEARFGYLAAVNTSTLTDGVVLELGGGSTQLINLAGRRVRNLSSFALGAVRLTETFLAGSGPANKKDLKRLRARVRATLAELPWLVGSGGRIVGLGGAVRNLAAAAQPAASELGVQGFVISRERLEQLVRTLASISATERGTVPGIKPGRGDIILAAAVTLATVLELGNYDGIEVTEASLREGVFFARTLLPKGEHLLADVRTQAVHNLAIQHESDIPHVQHVATLCLQMFDSLAHASIFTPASGERELLWAAAILHDVGMTISYDDHHKHSRYLIASAELPGWNPRERALIAQITRYQRKGAPKLDELSALSDPGDEQLLHRCSMFLRLAEHLERGRDQSVTIFHLRPNGHSIRLHLEARGRSLILPRWSLERYRDHEPFQRGFGRRLLIA